MSVAYAPPQELFACSWGTVWIWKPGHLDKSKFKGWVLSNHRSFDAEYDTYDLVRAPVRHGWVVTVAGDTSGCGWDTTTYLERDEPHIVDGRWVKFTTEEGVPLEVVDGPHLATWLELR
jgi:hypothetical protein